MPLCQQASVQANDVATATLSVLALPVNRLRSVHCTPPMMTDLGLLDRSLVKKIALANLDALLRPGKFATETRA